MTPPIEISPSESQVRNELSFTHLGESALGALRVLPATHAHEAAYSNMLAAHRAALLELPRNEVGLDIESIEKYREEIGAPPKPLLFLDPENYYKAIAIHNGAEGDKKTPDGDHGSEGSYLYSLDVIVVKRDEGMEELNGPGYTESLAVHEIAHSSGTINPVQIRTETVGRFRPRTSVQGSRSRVGFVVRAPLGKDKVSGFMLEEGYAELERGRFMEEQGRAGGFVTPGQDFEKVGPAAVFPGHYWCLRPDKDTGVVRHDLVSTRSALPAAGLELLVEQDNQLLGAMRKSRSDVNGLREVAKRINAIVPGLYEEMMAIDLDGPTGLQQASLVFAKIYKATRTEK